VDEIERVLRDSSLERANQDSIERPRYDCVDDRRHWIVISELGALDRESRLGAEAFELDQRPSRAGYVRVGVTDPIDPVQRRWHHERQRASM
jgi:hypothetical protein